MLEATSFNDWFYGTPLEELDTDKINVGVFNLQGIECLLEDSRLHVVPVYVATAPKERLMRALQREDNPNCAEVCRRFLSDLKDFDEISFDDYVVFRNDGAPIGNDLLKQTWAKRLMGEFI